MNTALATGKKQGISIFLRILIIFMSVNVLTSAILIVVAYLFNSETIAKRTRESVTQQVASIRDTYQKQYGDTLKSSIRALAESDALEAYLMATTSVKLITAQKVERLFSRELKNSPSLHSARYVDSAGDVMISVRGTNRIVESINLGATGQSPVADGPDAASLQVLSRIFRHLASTPLLLSSGYMDHFIPPRETTVEGPFLRSDGSVSAVAGIAKLDLESHGFGGVLLIQQNLNPFIDYLRDLKFFDENPVWVFDGNGRALLRPNAGAGFLDPQALIDPAYQAAVRLVDLPQGLIAYQDISMLPGKRFMRVVVSIPSALLTKDFNAAITFFSVVMVVSLAIVMLVALYVSRYLSRPIVQLSAAAARYATGDLSGDVHVKTTGEVQTLVDSFNHMTTELRAANASRDSAMRGLVNEVGERKRVELDLKEQAQELREARIAAETASLAKTQFLSTMSHEIRTPLNGVLGMSELLQHTRLDTEQARYAGAIAAAGRSLHELLSDVLDLAKIEEGKVEIEHVDFEPTKLLGEIAEVYRELASARGILFATRFESGGACLLSGDPSRFRQVVSNLVGNALKFTQHGSIELSCSKVEGPAGDARTWLRVGVHDTGVGMGPEQIGRLFQRFVQADASTTRRFGGSGLGLVICKYLVELMGGFIHVDSKPGNGSHFWFDLPFDPASGAALLPRQGVAARRVDRAHILVAEDNPINQQVVGSLLKHLGASVTVVENGALAVEALQREAFDLVLMDCQMPVLDGFGATAQIRKLPGAVRGVPIIALTANALAGDQRRCLEAGMDDYLAKPVTGAKLADVIARHLGVLHAAPAAASPAKQVDVDAIAVHGPASDAIFDPATLAALPMVADGSQPDFADEMLLLFESTAAQALDEMQVAIAGGHTQIQRRLMHTLKSSSAQVGARALSILAEQFEAELRAGRPAPSGAIEQLRSGLDGLKQAWRAWRDARLLQESS